jgi:16S rRNA (guanine(966)-N(2))-methyltransferase RsmD
MHRCTEPIPPDWRHGAHELVLVLQGPLTDPWPGMKKTKRSPRRSPDDRQREGSARLRIIGGTFRGRKLNYSGDERTRPMKDRVREAVFNLLGPEVAGKLAIDLFAGTGALGLEALSRGAARAIFVERHFPTAAILRQNIVELGASDLARLAATDVFAWAERELPSGDAPWLVFCSPPYAFYLDRTAEMLGLLQRLIAAAPPRSVLVVESDTRFDPARLPAMLSWDVRCYPPAVIAIGRMKPADNDPRN